MSKLPSRSAGQSGRIDYKLRLVGVRNIKVAHTVIYDRGDDIDKLRAAAAWMSP